jgi:hypothetical protein
MDHGLHDNKRRRGRRRLLQPVPSTRRPSSGTSSTSSTSSTSGTSGTSGIWYAAVAVPCRVSWPTPPGLSLSLHCPPPGLISLPALTLRHPNHPTIPPSHDTAAPCHDTINHAPADAPSMQGPFRLEPRTPPACRNALLPSFHLALRLLPSGPRCFWRRLRLYHAQRSHTLPLRFAHGPTVSHPNSSLSWSPSPSLLPAACCRSFLPRQRLGTPTARLPWPPSSPGQVARTTLRGRHLNLPR